VAGLVGGGVEPGALVIAVVETPTVVVVTLVLVLDRAVEGAVVEVDVGEVVVGMATRAAWVPERLRIKASPTASTAMTVTMIPT
jgi:hypothetical protein